MIWISAATPTSPAAAHRIARTLASRVSWPRSTVAVAMPTVSGSVAMRQRLLDERLVRRDELHPSQLPRERSEPQPAERERGHHVQPVKPVCTRYARDDDPVVVHEPHHEDQDGDAGE